MSSRLALRHRGGIVLSVGILAAGLSTGGLTLRASAGADEAASPTRVYALPTADLDALRVMATELADPKAALAAGYIDLDLCIDMMGDHYADPATFSDGVLGVAAPEALVYAAVDGAKSLVAVEWVSTAPGEVAGIPLHLNDDLDVWMLHAWIGLDNPSGMLADHNPDVGACDTTAPGPTSAPIECAALRHSPACR
jgi:hypothetical protein